MKIALTYTGLKEKQNNYIQWLRGEENIEILEINKDARNADEVNNCDGLLMTGGLDIHPGFYNGMTSYCNAPKDFDEARDQIEKDAFNNAIKKGIPVLGVCRGMQLINCVLGGSLQQDLGESLNKIHRAENKIDKIHGVRIVAESLIKEIVTSEVAIVNSAHHQAVDRLGKGLKINCRSEDGTIEGLEWIDPANKSFLLCVQWHPERMSKFNLENLATSRAIRERFINEIKKAKTTHS